jgi:hypothetical protein
MSSNNSDETRKKLILYSFHRCPVCDENKSSFRELKKAYSAPANQRDQKKVFNAFCLSFPDYIAW